VDPGGGKLHNILKNRAFSLYLVAAVVLQPDHSEAQSEESDADRPRPGPPTEYTLEYAQGTFDRFYEAENYIEAVDAGKLVIQVLLQEEEIDEPLWGDALTQLATAQRKSGDLDSAVLNYQAAIDVIEQHSDRLNSKLVDPMLGLSRTYVDAGEYDSAIDTYKKTLHINRVNFGVHNSEQSELLVEMSEAYFLLGDDTQDNLLRLPAMYSQADMLTRTDSNVKSQVVYRRIIGIIERLEGSKSLTLLPALYKISDVFLFNDILDGYNGVEQARRYIRRAVHITEKNDEATNLDKAEAQIAMGDFFSLKTLNHAAAVRSYGKAWDFLSADDNFRERRDELFDEPVKLSRITAQSSPAFLDLLAKSDRDIPKNGVVIAEYYVDRRGRARNVQVVESKPSGYKDYTVVSHLRGLVHRPRFVDREPVDSDELRYEIRYSYHDDELPERVRAAVAENVAAAGEPD
jgi:tetratricopeptide (TPR) repeat protein